MREPAPPRTHSPASEPVVRTLSELLQDYYQCVTRIGHCLAAEDYLIYHWPFWLRTNPRELHWEQFQNDQQTYHHLGDQYETIMKAQRWTPAAKAAYESTQRLYHRLIRQWLRWSWVTQAHVQPPALRAHFKAIRASVRRCLAPPLRIPPRPTDDTNPLLPLLMALEADLNTPTYRPRPRLRLNYSASPPGLALTLSAWRAIWLTYHAAQRYQAGLTTPTLRWPSRRPGPLFSPEPLAPSAYHSLRLLCQITPERCLFAVVEYQRQVYKKRYQRAVSQAAWLQAHFGFAAALDLLHWQRTQAVSQAWLHQLQKLTNTRPHPPASPAWSVRYQIARALWYEKLSYLRQLTLQQTIETCVHRTYLSAERALSQREPADYWNDQQDRVQQQHQAIVTQEAQLQSPAGLIGYGLHGVLWITQYPPYQLGQQVARWMSRRLDQQQQVPWLQTVLPPLWQTAVEHLTASSYLALELIGLSRGGVWGMAFLLSRASLSLTLVSRLLIDLPRWEGRITETRRAVHSHLARLLPAVWVHRLTALFRLDLATLAHHSVLWQESITFSCLLVSYAMGLLGVESLMAYVVLRLTLDYLSGPITQAAHERGYAPDTVALIRAVVQVGGAFAVYWGGLTVLRWLRRPWEASQTVSLPRGPSGPSVGDALETFGFYRRPTQATLRDRYHTLARRYHPDKCKRALCDATEMEAINAAYNVLRQ